MDETNQAVRAEAGKKLPGLSSADHSLEALPEKPENKAVEARPVALDLDLSGRDVSLAPGTAEAAATQPAMAPAGTAVGKKSWSMEEVGSSLLELLTNSDRAADDIDLIRRAYEFAYKSHDGQLRKSDDPYIIHPVEVAISLAKLNADKETIASALLHDVLEDCDVQPEEIEKHFGSSIRRIVEGVTKLGKFSFSSKEERQAENFRKLIMAISEDVRVVLVKLADRLHNMKTLDHMRPEKQKEIAQETIEIYAPLANRFGLGRVKWELEDLSLKYLYQDDYRRIEELVASTRSEREGYVNEIVERLRIELESRGIKAEVKGRPKHLFGIWKKMKRQSKAFEELYDVFAIRVIVESDKDKNYCELASDPDTQKCYEVMGLVHSLFRPIPGRFKDYIAMPKPNSYQSLHTAVMGPQGRPVEVQIRTRRMHHVAEYGIAAHWRYKEVGEPALSDSAVDRKLAWLRQLVEWQEDLKDAREYLDTVKMDLFSDEVFVFSPRGDVFDLPRGATSLDFAYRIHTEVGNHVTGTRVNDRMVPLATVLRNGDIVEIITSKNAHPRMDWLNIAQTHSAKSRIRQWFKKYHREEHISQGRQLLESEFGRAHFEELLRSDKFKEAGRKLNLNEPDDILAAVGYGDISVAQIVNRIREQEAQEKPAKKESHFGADIDVSVSKSNVSSLQGLLHHLAQCCSPVPGEPIMGVVTRGSGITVHRFDCANLLRVEHSRQMELSWSDEEQGTYSAYILIECLDRVGIAGDILKKISDNKINISDLRVEVHGQKKTAAIHVVVEVKNVNQLRHVMQSIGQISDVLHVQRQNHRRKSSMRSAKNNVTEFGKRSSNSSRHKSPPRK